MELRKETWPCWVGGRPVDTGITLDVVDKYTGEVAARVAVADTATIGRAIGLAQAATAPLRRLGAWERQAILEHCAARFAERAREFTDVLCIEAGKPLRDARTEVARLIDTFRIAASEAVRMHGQELTMDVTPRARGYRGRWKRVPIGPCSFIAPFNFPLNLAAHKIAPALAVGCPFVLKPASLTPLGALMLGEVLAETALPEGSWSILPCPRDGADLFAVDERFKLLSFTGSASVGWHLKARAGKKKVLLELGGNAAAIVDRDWDVDDAVDRVATGAFFQSGQSCISVQRIFAHVEIYERFRDRLVERTRALVCGDPRDEATTVGPMISEREAVRVETWIRDAVVRGGRLLCGGGRCGPMLEATLLEDVPPDAILCREEAFGPVAVLEPFDDFDAALAAVNDSAYGLQAGVFTRDLYRAEKAWDVLEVGGVVIGDAPSWRVDHMPYGGVKDSGLGREGVRFAMEEMSEIRMLAIRGQ